MNAKETMKLPANCTLMTEEEMMYTDGGTAAETAVKAVIAVGGALDAGKSFLNALIGL